MSDSEDDYMSLKILKDCETQDVRPSLLANREKRKHEQYKNQLESLKKKQKSVRQLEHENREKGLQTAISSDNKGFKLLEKMGFKAGNSLGKSNSGVTEPINITFKCSKSGIGRDTHTEKVITSWRKKTQNLKEFETKYSLSIKEKNNLAQIKRDFLKAQKMCEELDYRKGITSPSKSFYWPKEAVKRLKKNIKTDSDDTDDSSSDEEEQGNVFSEENLCVLIDYIRNEHLYCIFCAIIGTDERDLEENCPGPYRNDHLD